MNPSESATIPMPQRFSSHYQARQDYRERADGKTLAAAAAALGHFIATSPHIRGAVAQRSIMFDSLVSALRPKVSRAVGGGNGGGGGGSGAGSTARDRSGGKGGDALTHF